MGDIGTILRTSSPVATAPPVAADRTDERVWLLSRVYPNPVAHSDLTVEIESSTESTLSFQVVSPLGQVMLQRFGVRVHKGRNAVDLPLSTISADGTYQLVVQSATGSSAITLVIQR